ncbi:MAG: hypothetical protein HOP33_18735 [Verrucomicrobia bacterium]|nr:hypothetical protein [Verrucomicrobiota bacterium]
MKHSLSSIFAASLLFVGCVATPNTPQNKTEELSASLQENALRVGMKRAKAVKLLSANGCTEVAKDVLPDGKGWSVGNNNCLLLSFTNDILASICIESNSNEPKAFRRFFLTNFYELSSPTIQTGGK